MPKKRGLKRLFSHLGEIGASRAVCVRGVDDEMADAGFFHCGYAYLSFIARSHKNPPTKKLYPERASLTRNSTTSSSSCSATATLRGTLSSPRNHARTIHTTSHATHRHTPIHTNRYIPYKDVNRTSACSCHVSPSEPHPCVRGRDLARDRARMPSLQHSLHPRLAPLFTWRAAPVQMLVAIAPRATRIPEGDPHPPDPPSYPTGSGAGSGEGRRRARRARCRHRRLPDLTHALQLLGMREAVEVATRRGHACRLLLSAKGRAREARGSAAVV